MTEDRSTGLDIGPNRHLSLALAALREAAEHLEDVVAASPHPNLGVASALSHVVAARKALKPHGLGTGGIAVEQDAA